jgi:hypothetical protein
MNISEEWVQKREEMLERGICPRCGQKYDYLEERQRGGNIYLYAIHVTWEGGKRKLRKCYLGPKGQYIYGMGNFPQRKLPSEDRVDYNISSKNPASLEDFLRGDKYGKESSGELQAGY